MKCVKCGRKAVINIRYRNLKLCKTHFIEHFEKTVESTIKKFKMFDKRDKILVAVSGGKDSLALWNVLNELGYRVSGLYIDLGIGDYSKISREKVLKFSKERDLELIIRDIKEVYGKSLEEIKARRKMCSVCGTIKRHEMNVVAYENNFDVIATGHNLDDESSVLLSNILRWQIEFLSRQYPVLEPWHRKLRKKVKPLCFLTEKETKTYAILKNIDHVEEECPYSKNASTLFIKSIMNAIEERFKGTKYYFYSQFLKNINIFKMTKNKKESKEDLKECKSCGFPTNKDYCSFCRILR